MIQNTEAKATQKIEPSTLSVPRESRVRTSKEEVDYWVMKTKTNLALTALSIRSLVRMYLMLLGDRSTNLWSRAMVVLQTSRSRIKQKMGCRTCENAFIGGTEADQSTSGAFVCAERKR